MPDAAAACFGWGSRQLSEEEEEEEGEVTAAAAPPEDRASSPPPSPPISSQTSLPAASPSRPLPSSLADWSLGQ